MLALTSGRRSTIDRGVKTILPLALLFVVVAVLSSCTTLENRRDLYSPNKVNGPYTRMLKERLPAPPSATPVQLEPTEGK